MKSEPSECRSTCSDEAKNRIPGLRRRRANLVKVASSGICRPGGEKRTTTPRPGRYTYVARCSLSRRLFCRQPPSRLTMALLLHRQPFKGVYVLSFLAFVVSVQLPYLLIYYSWRPNRPRKSLTLYRTVNAQITRNFARLPFKLQGWCALQQPWSLIGSSA